MRQERRGGDEARARALTPPACGLPPCSSVNLMDEAYLLEHIKEQLCFVSQDLQRDLGLARQRRSPHRHGSGAHSRSPTAL